MKASGMITRPACWRPSETIAVSISASSRTGAVIGSIASDRAAASNGLRKYAPPRGAVSGLNMLADRLTRGESSLSNSSHLPLRPRMNLVMFPPGRGRPVTNPEPTGSETITNTMGMVLVSRCSAAVTGVVAAKDHVGVQFDQLFGEDPHPTNVTTGPTIIDLHIAAVCPAQFLQLLCERCEIGLHLRAATSAFTVVTAR